MKSPASPPSQRGSWILRSLCSPPSAQCLNAEYPTAETVPNCMPDHRISQWQNGHRRDTMRWGTAGIFCGWALLGTTGLSPLGHCWDALRFEPRLGSAGAVCCWALQGYTHIYIQMYVYIDVCVNILYIYIYIYIHVYSTWALQGYPSVGQRWHTLRLGTAVRLAVSGNMARPLGSWGGLCEVWIFQNYALGLGTPGVSRSWAWGNAGTSGVCLDSLILWHPAS